MCFEILSKFFFDGNFKNFRKIVVVVKKNVLKSKNCLVRVVLGKDGVFCISLVVDFFLL